MKTVGQLDDGGDIMPHLVGAGHQVGGALPVAHGAADVRVTRHHQPLTDPPPPIHGGVNTAQHWQLETTTSKNNDLSSCCQFE